MKNKDIFNDAKKYIPGGVNSPVRAFMNVGLEPFISKKGVGAYIIDEEDKKYLDFVQSWGPLIFGHCDKEILNEVINTAKNGLSFGTPCLLETTLAKLVLEDFKFLDKIRFVNSGTEATMSAIRAARGYNKKDGIIKFEGCYHGHSDSLLIKAGSGASTFGHASSSGVPQGSIKNTYLAKYNDLQSVEDIVKNNDIATIIIEPIAGNMGLVPAEKDFLTGLRQICDKHEIILIFDEVMSGYRASKTGSYDIYGIKADMVTFGKVIGGGMPCAAYAGKKEIMDNISPLGPVYQAGTLSGNPVAMAAGIASIKKIKNSPNLYDKLSKLAQKFTQNMQEIAHECGIPLQTTYVGSMFGYFFNENVVKNYDDALKSDLKMFAKFYNECIQNSIFLAPSQFETGFICDAMDEQIIDDCNEKIRGIFKKL